MKCEKCSLPHEGKYGSGRFCSSKCARGFSTKSKRSEINEKISEQLSGRVTNRKGKKTGPFPAEFGLNITKRAETRWKEAPWDQVPGSRRRDRILLEQGGVCAICKNPPVWMGSPLKFQLDHVSGVRTDNSRANLRLLCPNCHYQTPTWGARNASPEGKERMLAMLELGRKARN